MRFLIIFICLIFIPQVHAALHTRDLVVVGVVVFHAAQPIAGKFLLLERLGFEDARTAFENSFVACARLAFSMR